LTFTKPTSVSWTKLLKKTATFIEHSLTELPT